MSKFSARRTLSACALSAAAVAALAAPGAASASIGAHCSGTAIKGEGSSFQKIAQEVWGTSATNAFNHSKNPAACNGEQGEHEVPAITYAPNGSGAGLKAFGVENTKLEGKTVQFAGTDEPPNQTQKNEIEAHESPLNSAPEAVETIPVVQGSVAVIVHLPTGCTATSTAAPGRLVLQNKTLEAIWKGAITTWGQIKESGDAVTGAGCEAATIKHVVRLDQSGTTHIFKKYLAQISAKKFAAENAKNEGVGKKTWSAISEGPENTSWPAADKVIRPAAKGGGEVVAKVAAEAGSIGYANLGDARKNAAFAGTHAETFWVEVQNNGIKLRHHAQPTYADPSDNEESATTSNSNCGEEVYTNGKGEPFPPASTKKLWNNVTTSTVEPKYTLCGLTYDLTVTAYSKFIEAPTETQVTTVVDYLTYILNETKAAGANGGQVEIENRDYERLPKALDKEALAGVEETSF
jgi:ABC-type phosphate transport system substrate-binding protein